ncbi:interleukin 15, like isoform X3 [Cheilinus undulatus]|uniref:interleukin 15, like isoform X3 n=1 Tax=Cheilinus undulatus TaxID=241271 RepID=UPI001BD35A79|nr:interleukin 15, like isoform X3 [Cheilinus undulatus]
MSDSVFDPVVCLTVNAALIPTIWTCTLRQDELIELKKKYQNCSKSALKCFAAEVTVIIQEWKTIEKVNRKWDLDEKLAEVADLLNQTNPECLQCEQLKEENAKDFFRVLETFIQLMNSAPGDCKSYS